jgi:hypothetical protein
MDYSKRLSISYYKTIATLNEKKKLLEEQYEDQIAHEKEIIK